MVEKICVLELFGRIIDSRYYQKMQIHLLAESTLFLLNKADVSHLDTRTAVCRYSAAFDTLLHARLHSIVGNQGILP